MLWYCMSVEQKNSSSFYLHVFLPSHTQRKTVPSATEFIIFHFLLSFSMTIDTILCDNKWHNHGNSSYLIPDPCAKKKIAFRNQFLCHKNHIHFMAICITQKYTILIVYWIDTESDSQLLSIFRMGYLRWCCKYWLCLEKEKARAFKERRPKLEREYRYNIVSIYSEWEFMFSLLRCFHVHHLLMTLLNACSMLTQADTT